MKSMIIIPAYNPDVILETLVQECCMLGHEVLVVDDGSDAACWKIFQRLESLCVVLHHSENRGKGAAVKTALDFVLWECSDCQVIGTMDADGQHLAADMDKLLAAAEDNPGRLVLGVREVGQEMPWKSRAGNSITRLVFQIVSGQRISDTQTGLRAFSRDIAAFMKQIPGERYEYEMNCLLACAKQNIPFTEIPIQTIYHDQKNSCSHFRKVKDSVRIYKDIIKFGLSSFSSFLVDYITFVILTALLPPFAGMVFLSNILARGVSAWYNYSLNCRFVFHEKKKFKTAAGYFGLAAAILLLNNLIMAVYMDVLLLSPYPAKLLTEITLFVISWLVQSRIIFQKQCR